MIITDLLRVCQNCNHFIQDPSDLTSSLSLGICALNEVFEPYLEDIFEEGDFSGCWDLYVEHRFTGEREPCDDYDEVQFAEDGEEALDYEGERILEQIRDTNVDEAVKYLHSDNFQYVRRAFYAIEKYVRLGNKSAQKALLEFYRNLGPAAALDDVHLRVQMINTISSADIETDLISIYIDELFRTPSNNTTRQLYTVILEKLGQYSFGEIGDPILNLLEKKEFAPKMRQRLLDLL